MHAKYQHKGLKRWLEIITPITMHFQVILYICLEVSKDGSVYAKKVNPGVSGKLLKEIHSWREGASDKDVIIRLRQRTVSDGYSYHNMDSRFIDSSSCFH